MIHKGSTEFQYACAMAELLYQSARACQSDVGQHWVSIEEYLLDSWHVMAWLCHVK